MLPGMFIFCMRMRRRPHALAAVYQFKWVDQTWFIWLFGTVIWPASGTKVSEVILSIYTDFYPLSRIQGLNKQGRPSFSMSFTACFAVMIKNVPIINFVHAAVIIDNKWKGACYQLVNVVCFVTTLFHA